MLDQGLGLAQVVKVVFGEGVIGGEQPELECQVEAGWGFTGAGDTNQNHIRLIVVACAGAVIVVQGKMYGIDTNAVGLGVADGMALVDLVAGTYA